MMNREAPEVQPVQQQDLGIMVGFRVAYTRDQVLMEIMVLQVEQEEHMQVIVPQVMVFWVQEAVHVLELIMPAAAAAADIMVVQPVAGAAAVAEIVIPRA